jgi:cytochrome c-type biogenesis protein CcmH
VGRPFVSLLLVLPLVALAQNEPIIARGADAVLEQRVKRLTEELRCLVCQNQTIADSQAQLAIDLKKQVREQLAQGASDQQAMDYMVQRYGDFVLYRPPLKGTTGPLWFGPLAMLLAGLAILWSRLRRQDRPAHDAEEEGGAA